MVHRHLFLGCLLLLINTTFGGLTDSFVAELIAMMSNIIPEQHMQRIAPSLLDVLPTLQSRDSEKHKKNEQQDRFVSQFTAALAEEATAYSNMRLDDSGTPTEATKDDSPFAHVMPAGSVSSEYPYFGMIPKVNRRTPPGCPVDKRGAVR